MSHMGKERADAWVRSLFFRCSLRGLDFDLDRAACLLKAGCPQQIAPRGHRAGHPIGAGELCGQRRFPVHFGQLVDALFGRGADEFHPDGALFEI